MGAVHVRTPKNFVLEERLERYADAIETNPEAYAGDWREACAPVGSKPFEHLHLDLGCGKGTYLVERAAHEPNTLFIGMDQEPICIAYAAQKICEQELSNALVLPRGAASLPQLFAAGELDAITINFPTPQPKAKYAKKRLVHVDHLMLYRPLFAVGATVTLRTDSKPLRDYALAQPGGVDLAIVVADGLSALAVHKHTAPFLARLEEQMGAENWSMAPVILVEQGRVAVADEVGELLGAKMTVILIGERPGLSSPDSLGLYFTYNPKVGLTDAYRNCISNVRLEGLSYGMAAHRLLYLMREACRRQLSGVNLKDEAQVQTLESDDPDLMKGNFLLSPADDR